MDVSEIIRHLKNSGVSYTPNAYMRLVRPEEFSDSIDLQEQRLAADLLSFSLDQLTTNKKEAQFEEFARRLAQLEICPNLVPQTGPTGGGDSKTDSVTYPVAESLVRRCCWASPEAASDGDWAFAMSCKKEWRSKLKSDVEKIAGLSRKFTKVFFITNQPVRDKVRAQLEEELGSRFTFDLRILDRTWIVAKVTENRRDQMTIELLGLEVAAASKPRQGTNDTSRQNRLDALRNELSNPSIYHGNDYALAQDYLTAAELSAGLEKPRHEIDGLFTRAEDIATVAGHKSLAIECYYQHAWRCFFWHNDVAATERLYTKIETLIAESINAEEWEMCHRLLTLQETAAMMKVEHVDPVRLRQRQAAVKAALERLATDVLRPSNALQAETILRITEMREALREPTKAQAAIDGMLRCLDRAEGLGTYPLRRYVDHITRMGDMFCRLPGYDILFDRIEQAVAARLGETAAGEQRLAYGLQLLERNRYDEALKNLGQARVKLYKEETLDKGIQATFACAAAYRGLGLLWAARMEALAAAHATMRSWDHFQQAPMRAFFTVKFMAWIELELGRVEPFLTWHHFAWNMLPQLASQQIDISEFEEELLQQDRAFGCFLLNLPRREAFQLRELEEPMRTIALCLPQSRVALLFALGRIEELKLVLPDDVTDEASINKFFQDWKNQPATQSFRNRQTPSFGPTRVYETVIMGVRYKLKCPNTFWLIAFADNFLGVLESALAGAKWENLAFVAKQIEISIEEGPHGYNPPKLDFEDASNCDGYHIVWGENMMHWVKHNMGATRQFMQSVLMRVLLSITIDPFEDLKKEFDEWQKMEAFSRALASTPSGVYLADIIDSHCYELKHWTTSAFAPQIFG